MERSLMVEKNHRHDNTNCFFKSTDPSIKIGSISIDLIDANENGIAEKCEHFSIRGYVSQFRQKNWKMCSPFTSDAENDKCEEKSSLLPPLEVPKFRFWRCQNCLHEISAKVSTAKDYYGPVQKFCDTGFKLNSICSHAPIHSNTAMLLSSFQQSQKIDILKETNDDSNPSASLNKTIEYHPSSVTAREEKKNEVENGLTRGHLIASENNLNREILKSCVASEVYPKVMQEKVHTDDIGAKSKCNGSIDLFKPDTACHDPSSAAFAGNLNIMVKDADEIGNKGKEVPTSADNQREELIACGTPGEADNGMEASADKVNIAAPLSQEVDENGYASSESADITIKDKLHDLHHDISGSLHRKKRKVRLLTELLCENGDGDTNIIRTEESPSNINPDASTTVDKPPVPQSQMAIQGNARRCSGNGKKRKVPQYDYWRPQETGTPNEASKAIRILRDTESIDAIAGSESEEYAVSRLGSQIGVKNHWTKRRVDRSTIIGKKKDKRTPTSDECLNLETSQEHVPIESAKKTGVDPKDIAADGVLLKSGTNEFTGREIDFFPMSATRMERKPSLNNKKNKKPKIHDSQSWNHDILSEGLMARKDAEFMHTGSVVAPLRPVQDSSSGKALNLSLNSCIATQSYDKKHFPEEEDWRTSLLNQQMETSGDDQVKKDTAVTKNDGKFIVASKSVADAPLFGKFEPFLGKFVQNDLSCKRPPTYRMPFCNERQSYTSHTEVGSSLTHQKDFCTTSCKEKTIGNQEDSAVKRRDGDQRVDKMPDQGALDDIPMEIVELMAKNQYERCLADAEYKKCRLETLNNSTSPQIMDFTKAYGHRELNFFRQETAQKRKTGPRDETNGIIKGVENVGPTKQKSGDFLSQAGKTQFSISQLEQAHIPVGYADFLHRQEKSSNGVQHPASTSIKQNSAQNCQLVGDLGGKRMCSTSSQAAGPCNMCQSNPQQGKELNHLWSSIMSNHPNHIPLYSLPQKQQKHSSLSTNIEMVSHFPGGMHKENINGSHDPKFLNQSLSYFGKQNRNFGPETLSRACGESPFSCKHNGIELNQKPMGSLDLYSNETIPAMHLLSLMDAGLRSNAPVNVDATPKFIKRPAIHDHAPKESSKFNPVPYKVNNAMKHPLYDYRGKNQAAEPSIDCIPPIPTISSVPTSVHASASVSSFQLDKSFKRTIDFAIRGCQEKDKTNESDSHTQNKGPRSHKHASTSGNFGSNCGSVPVHDMHTMLFGPQDSTMFPLQFHSLGNSINRKLEASNAVGTVNPHKSSLKTEFCSLNRNPSDFSIPEAGNVYMIAGEDLRFGKLLPCGNERSFARANGYKRQKKLPAVKEHERPLIL